MKITKQMHLRPVITPTLYLCAAGINNCLGTFTDLKQLNNTVA